MREAETRARRFAKSLRSRMTDAEVILWSRLRSWREQGLTFRRQHPMGPYIADFVCMRARLVVELDGEQHGITENHAYDLRRDAYMQSRGWRVIRITNDRVYRNLGEVLDIIAEATELPPRR
jgi:very-short-patch-repair endonuclease